MNVVRSRGFKQRRCHDY